METEKIWNLYSEDVFKFILSRVRDKDVTLDLQQEVFIRVHLKKGNLQEEAFLKNWIFSIARNLVTDYFRKKVFSENPLEAIIEDPKESTAHSPEDCLDPLIKNLPKKYREALILSDIQGKKQAEVAKELNISLSGAKSRIQRSRKLLQQGYIECCDYQLKEGILVGETKPRKDCKVCG